MELRKQSENGLRALGYSTKKERQQAVKDYLKEEGLPSCTWVWSKVMLGEVVMIYLEAPYTQPF